MTHQRTRSEVLEARKRPLYGGCCERFGNQMACDCLENALPDPPKDHIEAILMDMDADRDNWGLRGILWDALKDADDPRAEAVGVDGAGEEAGAHFHR